MNPLETRVEILNSSHRPGILKHFMGLSEIDRKFRFNSNLVSSVEDYLKKMDFINDRVLGILHESSFPVAVGHLYFYESQSKAYVCLSVDPCFRKLGYGKILLTEAKKVAQELKFEKLIITCSSFNRPMLTLAEKNGFRMISCRDYEWEGGISI
ncbi:MAG: GNAT family N-acetyltransferase [Chlamydiales bacterium]|nr:GNAT family N-acetyltransferase [Chlamydiales bacterium]